jgi:hypothetical protein
MVGIGTNLLSLGVLVLGLRGHGPVVVAEVPGLPALGAGLGTPGVGGLVPGAEVLAVCHQNPVGPTRLPFSRCSQRLLGHTNIATTTRYLHLSDADLAAAVDRAFPAE